MGVLTRLARLRRDRRGVAAVEFAMILPILVFFFLGLTELQPAISIKRKLALVTRTLADLTTRSPDANMSGAEMTKELKNIFGASSAIMRPYDNTGATQMVVTSIDVTKSGSAYTGKVKWSCPWNLKSSPGADDLKARSKDSSYPVPAGFQNDSTRSFVLVETLYPYTPTIGYTIWGTIKLKDSSPWPVRDSERVVEPNGCPTKT
jgi:hypothetical protein